MKKLFIVTCSLLISLIAHGQIINVPGDYLTIQGGINAANNGDTVLVDEGTYKENIYFLGKKIVVTSKYAIDREKKHIQNTIIDGSDAWGEEYASCVHFVQGEDTSSVLMGFTLINGAGYQNRMGGGILVSESGAKIIYNHIIGSKLVAYQAKGAGIYAASMSTATTYKVIIENNVIEGDSAYCVEEDGAYGGGIYIETMSARIKGNQIFNCLANGGIHCLGAGICCISYNQYHKVEIIENDIHDNKCRGDNNIGGGIYVYNFKTYIADNHVYNNVTQGAEAYYSFAQGGGISIEKAGDESYIIGNLIEKNKCKNGTFQNWAGGLLVYNVEGALESVNRVYIDGNTIRKNKAYWGAGSYAWRSNVSFTNNFFHDNYAQEYGGAIYFNGTTIDTSMTLKVVNNTFFSNAAVKSGASIYCTVAMSNNLLLMNNIFWKDLAADELTVGLANLAIFNCDIPLDSINGEWEGSGNFRKDPLLGPDYGLSANSPCKNAGAGQVLAFGDNFDAPLHDVRRITRPQGNYFDVGAFEIMFGESDTLDIGGLERIYTMHLPKGYFRDSMYPLVVCLHGEESDGQFLMNWTAFNETADAEGFIIVYPDAVDKMWNASLDGPVDDVAFIETIIDEIASKYSLDANRVYVCGQGLGGVMANALTCRLSNKFTAFASINGIMDDNLFTDCEINRQMPFLAMNGTADEYYNYFLAEEMVNFWNNHNTTAPEKTEILPDIDPTDGCLVEKSEYVTFDDKCKVLFYKIIDGGHDCWPGSKWKTDTTQFQNMDINANQEIWNFFRQYRLSDFTAINEFEEVNLKIKVYPNPSYQKVNINYKLESKGLVQIILYNQIGQRMKQITNEQQTPGNYSKEFNTIDLIPGVYTIYLSSGNCFVTKKLVKL